MQEHSNIHQFINDLIIQKPSMRNLQPEIQQELRDDLTNKVTVAINMAMINALPPEDAQKCITYLESGQPDEVAKLIDEKVTNVAEVTAIAMANFKRAYLAGE